MTKKVFIFGAGASVPANLPIQSQLLNKIFTLTEQNVNAFFESLITGSSEFMNSDTNYTMLMLGTYSDFIIQRRVLAEFLVRAFGADQDNEALDFLFNLESSKISDNDYAELYKNITRYNISFENIFTFLDKAITLPEFIQMFTDSELRVFHRALIDCITYIISYYSYQQNNFKFYSDFAKSIINYRTSIAQEQDNIALISINWDSIFDNFIHSNCIETKENKIGIDYCVYNECIDNFLPSSKLKAKGIYNIKLLKPHGSTNWLSCKNCGRLYTHYTNDITIRNMSNDVSSSFICPYCDSENNVGVLDPIIITPTFIKSLENIHLKSIWHNMLIEISEADELFFIGYSLPDADFEFKYLLKKAVKKSTKIKVILHKSDDPKTYKYLRKGHIYRMNLPELRYIELFPQNVIEFNYSGFDAAYYHGYFGI